MSIVDKIIVDGNDRKKAWIVILFFMGVFVCMIVYFAIILNKAIDKECKLSFNTNFLDCNRITANLDNRANDVNQNSLKKAEQNLYQKFGRVRFFSMKTNYENLEICGEKINEIIIKNDYTKIYSQYYDNNNGYFFNYVKNDNGKNEKIAANLDCFSFAGEPTVFVYIIIFYDKNELEKKVNDDIDNIYIKIINQPRFDRPKLFANIKQISLYSWHKNIYFANLDDCLRSTKNSIEEQGFTFEGSSEGDAYAYNYVKHNKYYVHIRCLKVKNDEYTPDIVVFGFEKLESKRIIELIHARMTK